VAIEVRRARARLRCRAELVPVLWLDDPSVASAVAASLQGAPEGISFFPTGDQREQRLAQVAAYFEQCRLSP